MIQHLFQNSFVQIIFRCLAIYLFIIVALRVFGKKELAQLSVIDLVFILLISNAVQNAMVGPDVTLLGGIVAAGSLFVMNYILKWLLFKSKRASELLQGISILLIYKGEIQRHNLSSAEITVEELETAVREHGVSSIKEVNLAMLEVDGNISVISNDFKTHSSHAISSAGRKHKLKGRIRKN